MTGVIEFQNQRFRLLHERCVFVTDSRTPAFNNRGTWIDWSWSVRTTIGPSLNRMDAVHASDCPKPIKSGGRTRNLQDRHMAPVLSWLPHGRSRRV